MRRSAQQFDAHRAHARCCARVCADGNCVCACVCVRACVFVCVHAPISVQGMVGKWHLGGTADGRALPTRHGFDSYWGMPITNVQACKPGRQEYQQSTLFTFILSRKPTGAIFGALAFVALTPWALGWYLRWRVCTLALVLAAGGYIIWYTGTLTLINSKACFLYANETLIEQPVQLCFLDFWEFFPEMSCELLCCDYYYYSCDVAARVCRCSSAT